MFANSFVQQTLQAPGAGVRALLETRVGARLQRRRVRREITREWDRLSVGSEATGYPIVNFLGSRVATRVAEEKRVFILGSGASVMELTEEHWREVRRSPSIGFGAWPLHPFVPDMLAFSPTRGLSDYEAVFTRVMARDDIVAAAPEVILLRSSLAEDIEMYSRLPEAHRSRASMYGRISLLSRTSTGLHREVLQFLADPGSANFGITLDSGSTLIRLISFAIRSGAREIVLLGVDLNTPEYFWDSNPEILHTNGFESFFTGQSGSLHGTMTDSRRPLSVDVVIAAIHKVFSDITGGNISIGSQYSALAQHLPVHRWGA